MTRSTSSPSDAFDELAAMFMTPAEEVTLDSPHEKTPDAVVPTTELLLVGHLPVRGNIWLGPYADAVARDVGPVALLRLDGDEPTLEIMRAPDSWRAEIAGQPLHRVIELIGSAVRMWIVRPRLDENVADASVLDRVDRVMLLSSADQAAGVSAYQTLKQLKSGADESGFDMPPLLMTVVGCAPESATWMIRRLQATAMAQLGVSIELDRVLERIDSEVQCSMYLRFSDDAGSDTLETLRMIDRAIAQERCAVEAERAVPAPPAHESAPRRAIRSSTNGHEPAAATGSGRAGRASAGESVADQSSPLEPTPPAPEWDPVVRPSVADRPAAARAGVRRIKLDPKPARQSSGSNEPKDSARDESADAARQIGSLAAHVPGLTALELRSPRSEHIELALDTAGRLHLLAEQAHLRELRIVEAWAISHRDLLTMALADRGFDPSAGVTCHLFTDEPAAVADLHGMPIKLHVLAPVEVDGHRGWYAAALNR